MDRWKIYKVFQFTNTTLNENVCLHKENSVRDGVEELCSNVLSNFLATCLHLCGYDT